MRAYIVWIVVAAVRIAEASPEELCKAGDSSACLTLAENAFDAGQKEIAVMTAIAVCDRGEGEGCLRAAHYMDKLRLSARAGRTSAQLRARAVKQFEDGCAADKGDACFRLGKALHQGKLMPLDATRGLALLEKACTLRDGNGCLFLGSIYKDDKRGLPYLDKACEAGSATGCTSLGERDKARAAELFAKACTGNDALGCARSGGIAKTAGRLADAVAAFERACELEHRQSCADAGALRASGKGVVDLAKARALYADACDEGLPAGCAAFAELMATDRGGARNWGKAVELARKACTLGEKAKCPQADKLQRTPPNGACTTIEACRALCGEKITKSCSKLALLIEQPGDEESCSDADSVRRDNCENGDGASCTLAGHREAGAAYAAKWYDLACKAGDAEGCALLDYTLLDSTSRQIASDSAASLAKRCAANRGNACIWHARVIEGRFTRQAQGYWRTACNRGDARACRLLASSRRGYVAPGGTCSDGCIGMSGEGDSRTPAQIRAEERAAAQLAAEVSKLYVKACDLGDAIACRRAYEDDAEIEKRTKAYAAAHPCTPDQIGWERSY